MYALLALLCAATVTVLDGASIDQIIMNAAPNSSALDMLHMSPEGDMLFMMELDILMDPQQYRLFRGSPQVRRHKRKAIRSKDYRWKKCFVYYEINGPDFSDEEETVIMEAMEEWRKYTCLQFKRATSFTKDKVVFSRGNGGCYSRLGRVGGPQEIGLSRGCVHRGVVIHEIGHAIGWIHEQARPDRDRYIRVNFNRIPPNWHSQFDKFDERLINDYEVEYDYGSIMHYSGNAVAPRSIETLDPKFQSVIGQRDRLSFRDIMLANLMYECSNMLCGGQNPDCSQYGKDAFLFMPDGDAKCRCFCPGKEEEGEEVMMPCDSSAHTTPTPTTRPPRPSTTSPPVVTSTAEPEPMECLDLREDCGRLAQQGECKMDMERMFVFCKKSCNFCEKENMCMDYDPSCPLLALGHFCDHPDFQAIMQRNCKKSCKLCTPVDPCKMQEQMGLMDHPQNSAATHPSPFSSLGFSFLLPLLLLLRVDLLRLL